MIDYLKLLLIIGVLLACGKKQREAQVERRDIVETVFATGNLRSHNSYDLKSEFEGYVSMCERDISDTIFKGTNYCTVVSEANHLEIERLRFLVNQSVLKSLPNSPDLLEMKARNSEAENLFLLDSIEFSKYERLFKSGVISETQYNSQKSLFNSSLENRIVSRQSIKSLVMRLEEDIVNRKKELAIAEANYKNGKVLFPENGLIQSKVVVNGDYVRKGDVMCTVAGLNNYFLELKIDEFSISKIEVNQKVEFKYNYSGDLMVGYITRIYPFFDSEQQTYTVEVAVDSTMKKAFVGSQIEANIYIDKLVSALLVPRDYVDFNSTVQVKGENERRKVEAFFYGTDWVCIKNGLVGNEVLITDK
jgi:multidrug efflux pump subunit AcrA (membrane-fusion protein)